MPSRRDYFRKTINIWADGSKSYQLWSRDCALKLVAAPVSSYFLVYDSEAILPANIAFRAPRVENYDEEQAAAIQTEDIDRAEEERLITCVHTAKYLEGLWRYYNCNIKGRSFAVGDLVLRRRQKK